jgi:hypothetical protein
MAVGKSQEGKMAPVHFFSHGSTMMLGEEHNSAKYWERMGDLALANGLEHVIMMVSIDPILNVNTGIMRGKDTKGDGVSEG